MVIPRREGSDFDVATEIWRDVDCETHREMMRFRAVLLCGHVGRSDTRLHIAWP
jgi:hypothetical protein